MEKKKAYKCCIVPMCTNTTIKTPEKMFFCVPKNEKMRKLWCQAMNRDMTGEMSHISYLNCCEDHFNLREDMTNYYQFKLMPGLYERKKLKRNVVPHIFECQNQFKLTDFNSNPSSSSMFERTDKCAMPCSKRKSTQAQNNTVDIKPEIPLRPEVVYLPSCSTSTETEVNVVCSREDKIHKALLNYIIEDAIPYRALHTEGFKYFISILAPDYILPDEETISKDIEKLYDETQDAFKEKLCSSKDLSLTVNLCEEDPAENNFVDVAVHFIDESWLSWSLSLSCILITNDYKTDDLKITLDDCFDYWKIKQDRFFTYTAESALEILPVSNIPCFGDGFNSSINNALKREELVPTLNKVKSVQKLVTRSPKIAHEISNLRRSVLASEVRVPCCNTDNWWSLLSVIEVISEQLSCIQEVLKSFEDGRYRSYAFEQQEINKMFMLTEVLNSYKEVSRNLSTSSYLSASSILPILNQIQKNIKSMLSEDDVLSKEKILFMDFFHTAIKTELNNKYLGNTGVQDLLMKSTILDPRFKIDFFDDERKQQDIIECILDEMEPIIQQTGSVEPPEKKVKVALFNIVSVTEEVDLLNVRERCDLELQKYFQSVSVDMDSDPFSWWGTNEKYFPALGVLARKYLCACGTTVVSENVFSKDGRLVMDPRKCRDGLIDEKLLFLHCNNCIIPKN